MITLSTGPFWRLIVDAAGPVWSEAVVSARVARTAVLAAEDGVVVRAEPWEPGPGRVRCAWALTGAVGQVVATDRPAFDGVPLTLFLPGLAVSVPADVLAGVVDGRSRRWWARRVDVRVGG